MITKPLGEIADILISNVDKKSKDNEKEVKLCNFVDVYYNWAITASNEKDFMIATASDAAIDKFTLHKGDVAITKDSETRNDIGVATYISEELDNVLLGYHCILIHPNEEIVLGKYLNVVLHSSYAQKYFEANASGSGQRYTLTDTLVKEMPIPLPDIDIQRKIGDIPSYIDRKIENNNKINAELESMAKTIYDYWFLQFEFPNEDGKPYKSSGGKMVWNEELKREIPEGWEYCCISELADIKAGGDKNKETQDYYDEQHMIPVYANGSEKKGLYGYTTNPTISQACITVAARGSIGLSFIRLEPFMPIIRLICVIPNDIQYLKFLEIFFNSIEYIKDGSIQQQLTIPQLSEYKIVVPKGKCIERFHEYTMGWQNEIIKNEKKNNELESLREFLLPLLMNGQIGFKET